MAQLLEYERGEIRTDRGIFLDKANFGTDPCCKDFSEAKDIANGLIDATNAFARADTFAAQYGLPIAPSVGTYLISSSIVITSPLVLRRGVILKPALGVTITLSATVESGYYQSFDTSLGGVISFSSFASAVCPMWWGAVGGGVTNDSVAFQGAYDAVATYGGIIIVPPGLFSATLSVYASNVWVVGAGSGITTVRQPPAAYRSVTDGATTNGSTTFNSASGAFTSADVNKTIVVVGAAGGGYDLVAIIRTITSGTSVVLDRAAGASVSGATARIGVGRNVIEFGKTYLGNNAPALSNGGVIGMTLDGNLSNVSNSLNEDIVNHGLIFTNYSNWVSRDVVSKNCHNAGLAPVIGSNYGTGDAYVESCGATNTMPGVDINSSSHITLRARSYLCYNGVRVLDNCFGNVLDFVVRKSVAQAAIFNNQDTNISTGNTIRITATECGTGSISGRVYIGANFNNNIFDITADYAGCTVTVSAGVDTVVANHAHDGVLVGSETITDAHKPKGNRIRATVRKNGGEGIIIRANSNDIEVVATENWQSNPLFSYAVEINGSYNFVRAYCLDEDSKQRGVIVRAQAGEVGTAATLNTIHLLYPNPTSPFTDSGTRTNCIHHDLGDGFRQTIDGWYYVDLAAGLAATNMTRIPLGTVAVASSWIAPRAGSVTAVQVYSNAARVAGTMTVQVYKNGVAMSSVTVSLNGTNTQHAVSTFSKGENAFGVGDRLECFISSDGSWGPVTADIRAAIELET